MTDIPSADFMKDFNKNLIEEFRANGGTVGGQFAGADLLLLTTTGAKSGQPRIAPLAYFTIDGKMIIIGSKAGADTNPDWVHNLRANPGAHIEVGTDAYDVTSRELSRDERDAIFDKVVAAAPPFGEYQSKTSRSHPAVRADPRLILRSGSQKAPDHDPERKTGSGYNRSMMVALAMPPASHIVCKP